MRWSGEGGGSLSGCRTPPGCRAPARAARDWTGVEPPGRRRTARGTARTRRWTGSRPPHRAAWTTTSSSWQPTPRGAPGSAVARSLSTSATSSGRGTRRGRSGEAMLEQGDKGRKPKVPRKELFRATGAFGRRHWRLHRGAKRAALELRGHGGGSSQRSARRSRSGYLGRRDQPGGAAAAANGVDKLMTRRWWRAAARRRPPWRCAGWWPTAWRGLDLRRACWTPWPSPAPSHLTAWRARPGDSVASNGSRPVRPGGRRQRRGRPGGGGALLGAWLALLSIVRIVAGCASTAARPTSPRRSGRSWARNSR